MTRRWWVRGWTLLLTLLVLAPVLAPGFVLRLDMVFVDRQVMLPEWLGIGAGLPRAVPQDALVAVISGPIPGQVLQKIVLVAIFVVAGLGVAHIMPTTGTALMSVSLYTWSAFLAQRLLMGHWGLLIAYALLPWIFAAAVRAHRTGRWYSVAALCAGAAWVPTGGVLAAVLALPIAVAAGSAVQVSRRWLLGACVALVNAPWWLPALRSDQSGFSDPFGLDVFGARADTRLGILGSTLTGGGIWNSEAVLPSRGTIFAALCLLVILALAAIGWSAAARLGWGWTWLTVLAVLGVGWAVLSDVGAEWPFVQTLVADLPGAGILRDAQKFTAYMALLVALSAPLGVRHLLRNTRDVVLRRAVVALVAIVPLAAMPDLLWGGLGRLQPTSYPAAWAEVREVVAEGADGDVVSLPFTPFRRYPWNPSGPVLDPMPRFLTRSVVWNDALPVARSGGVLDVAGDNPRAAAVRETIEAGEPLAPTLQAIGVRWIVIQADQPDRFGADLQQTELVTRRGALEVRQVIGPLTPSHPRDGLVVGTDVAALLVALWLAVAAVRVGLVAGRAGPDLFVVASGATDIQEAGQT